MPSSFDVAYRKKLKYGADKQAGSSVRAESNEKYIVEKYPDRKDLAEFEIRTQLSREFSKELLDNSFKTDETIKEKMTVFINSAIDTLGYEFPSTHARFNFVNNFIINLTGYGLLQPLIDDPAVTEIYVLAYNKVYVKRRGKKELTNLQFKNKEAIRNYVDAILSPLSRRVDTMNPIEDARLPNGDRVAISGDAISPQGITFNIRKFKREKMMMTDLIAYGTINQRMADMLKQFMEVGLIAIISGSTDSGKSTTLNALADYIAPEKMVATIEDNIELQLNLDMWLQIESRHPNIEGKGEVTLAMGLKHFLRRSPDIIIVGEIRDGAVAMVFLQAINTGHAGYSTIHANTPELCRQRMCNLIVGSEGYPYNSAEEDFNKAINIIIQLEKFNDINRIIMMNITYVENDGTMIDLAKFNPQKDDWDFIEQYPVSLQEKFTRYDAIRGKK
jgi:pilus assembly protein CpaF